MSNVLIVGATSAIAEAAARIYADRGSNLFLLARNDTKLEAIASDLKVRGATDVHYHAFEACDFDSHEKILEKAIDTLGRLDIVLIAHGSLPVQKECEESFTSALREINTNAVSVLSLLTYLANKMEIQGAGVIAVITSVAGDRGRQSNYIYGSAKGMVSIFLQGLRNRLYKSGVYVIDIKPGFVDTPMTEGFDKNLLWSDQTTIAKAIAKSIDHQRQTAYCPFFWRYIMMIIKMIPEVLFKRLAL
jgi:decaprenylphospho-beta-D-erythro-pentofuranosid-2-ulose 2-reductase